MNNTERAYIHRLWCDVGAKRKTAEWTSNEAMMTETTSAFQCNRLHRLTVVFCTRESFSRHESQFSQ
jgi:hypothetical protein